MPLDNIAKVVPQHFNLTAAFWHTRVHHAMYALWTYTFCNENCHISVVTRLIAGVLLEMFFTCNAVYNRLNIAEKKV